MTTGHLGVAPQAAAHTLNLAERRMGRGPLCSPAHGRAARRLSGCGLGLVWVACACAGDASMQADPGARGGAPRTVSVRNRCHEGVRVWASVDAPDAGAGQKSAADAGGGGGRDAAFETVGAGREVDIDLIGKQRLWLLASGPEEAPRFASTPAMIDGERLEIDSGCRSFIRADQLGESL